MKYLRKFKRRVYGRVEHEKRNYYEKTAVREKNTQLEKAMNSTESIFIFGSPFHSNMGDQAQSYCMELWCKNNYPNHQVSIIDTVWALENDKQIIKKIRKHIKPGHKIFLHSGYHMTDLYPLENTLIQSVVEMFKDFPIAVFPQTINYVDCKEAEKMQQIFSAHKRILLMCRDDVSFQLAKQMFPTTKSILFPDVVTTLIGKRKICNKDRNKIIFCTRNDKESVLKKDEIETYMSEMKKMGQCEKTDTTMQLDANYIQVHREKVLEKQLENFEKAKFVITDRYHGTIFSLIANTPVIVLNSSDHKLSSGVKWFPKEFRDYVYYAGTLKEASVIAEKIEEKQIAYSLPRYFEDNYYSRLKELIDNV